MQGLLGGVPLDRVPPVGAPRAVRLQRQAAADEPADGRHPAVQGVCDQGVPRVPLLDRRPLVRRRQRQHDPDLLDVHLRGVRQPPRCAPPRHPAANSARAIRCNSLTAPSLTSTGHNGKVRSISWTADDARLVSAGMDGAVYEWQLNGFKRVSENVLKSCAYTCAVCTPDARSIYAVGSDMKLKARRAAAAPAPACRRRPRTPAPLRLLAPPSSSPLLPVPRPAGDLRLEHQP